ncbi:hypothetical protein OB919_19985 [Halobacteria archaeon AArc-curdl1]|uniref:Uncharacterized protein n=1 Tax=Natronosalvus hydrolyticus TaxID=2979988 RepID=A0AAP2ZBL4_9EURY|nr:hypothetical protein [Halobacteria archaeon AArc-curdl1]
MKKPSRRQYLKHVSVGMVVGSLGTDLVEMEEVSHPPHPSISSGILERDGWEKVNQWRAEEEEAYWSATEYEWNGLRRLVRNKTDGLIDLPLGGLFLLRIGNKTSTITVNDRTLRNGETFTFPRWARRGLSGVIEDRYQYFINDFTVSEFESTGEINWSFSSIFPTTVDIFTQACTEGGSLNTEIEGSTELKQHMLDYRLSDDTANSNKRVGLETSRNLEFYGWNRALISEGQIYVLGSIHPRQDGEYCGLSDPHFERVLSDVTGKEIDLELDTNLTAQVRTAMGAVR